VLAALKETGVDGHTLVVFTSDNGPWLNAPPRMMQAGVRPWDVGSAGALRDAKGTTYEGGFRVPGIVRWPGRIPAGRVSAEMASGLDLFPTFLRLAGVDLPSDRALDGRDILPLLAGTGPAEPREFFYFLGAALHAVRDGRWKLRIVPAPKQEPIVELYDLEVDSSERYNVAAEHPDVVQRLRARLDAFSADVAAGK
jgi:arylsulfatase A